MRQHIQQFLATFKKHPVRAIWVLVALGVGDGAWELLKHKLCEVFLARLDRGGGPMIGYLYYVAQGAIDHFWLSVIGATLVGCGLLVLYFFGSVGRSVFLERRNEQRAIVVARASEIAALKGWMTESKREIGILQQSVSALALRAETLEIQFSKVLPSMVGLCEIISLIREADYCLEKFRFIYDNYPDSDVVAMPLNRSWREQTGLTTDRLAESLRLGIEWAEFLERHVLRVSAFVGNWNFSISSETDVLLRYTQRLVTPYEDKNGAECLGLLGKHRDNLRGIRDGYAASFTGSRASATIS
jgi:hypothetical protein